MKIKQIIYFKRLLTFPYEQEALREYHRFLKEHPEYDNENVYSYIQIDERDEDFHGRGDGIERSLIIYKYREETQDELNQRTQERDNKIISSFNEDFWDVFKSLQTNCKDINEKESIKKIVNSVREYIDYCFENNYIESKKIKLI